MVDADPLFHNSLIEAGYRHLYWKNEVKISWRQTEDITFMNLEALERMNLHFLRKQLLDNVAVYIWTGPKSKTDATAKKVSESLHQYCQAVRDRQLMSDIAKKGELRNPFMLRSDRILDGWLMEAMEGKMGPDPYPDPDPGPDPDRDVEKGASASAKPVPRAKAVLTRAKQVLTPARTKSFAKGYGKLPGGPWDYRHGQEWINLVQRAVGIFGAIIFVGPTILMVLVKGTLCRLLTSTLCTVAFAIGLSFWTRSAYDLVTGTAAYTAVLTVFVGATS